MNASTEFDVPLARRIEEASLNAWPAMQQTFLDGWVLRFSKGFTKRSNSIVPLYPPIQSTHTLTQKIRYCENLYAREQLQTVFRLTSIGSDNLDQVLGERGYRMEDTSLVLTTKLQRIKSPPVLRLLPVDQWLETYCDLTGMQEPARSLHSVILKAIQGECAFGVLYAGGAPVSLGLAVVEQDLAGLFDIYTADDQRGRGHGRALVEGLLDWAHGSGARRAYLQMVEENVPATALYAAFGFEEIYRYWYRIAP